MIIIDKEFIMVRFHPKKPEISNDKKLVSGQKERGIFAVVVNSPALKNAISTTV
jgi:hypothetical protein